MGRDLMKLSPRDFATYHRTEIGMVFQAYNLITSLSVLDNVSLPQIFINGNKKERDKVGRQLLDRFGILKQEKKIPTELSGGQQQRIGIARSIVNNPQIILADEPVGNLDSVSAKNVLDILEELNEKEHKTIIMVTHNPENLEYGDHIIYMKDGMVTREVTNNVKHKRENETGMAPKSPTKEIVDLMRSYQGLTPDQINILIMPYKAKMFANYFISIKNMEETKIFEDAIQRRLMGVIPDSEFFGILHRSSRDGGVGFDKRKAEKIVKRVNKLMRMAYFVYQKRRQRKNEQGEHDEVTFDEKAQKLSDYLLRTCYEEHIGNLNEVQVGRLFSAIKDRLSGGIQKSDFYNYLDKSFKESGVGLNSKTARAITDELELILVLGFGVVKINKELRDMRAAENSKKVIEGTAADAAEESTDIRLAENKESHGSSVQDVIRKRLERVANEEKIKN